jgi:hypothetical protein
MKLLLTHHDQIMIQEKILDPMSMALYAQQMPNA